MQEKCLTYHICDNKGHGFNSKNDWIYMQERISTKQWQHLIGNIFQLILKLSSDQFLKQDWKSKKSSELVMCIVIMVLIYMFVHVCGGKKCKQKMIYI